MNFKPLLFIRFFVFLAIASISWSGNFQKTTTLSAFAQEASNSPQLPENVYGEYPEGIDPQIKESWSSINKVSAQLGGDGYLELNEDEQKGIVEILQKVETNLEKVEKQKVDKSQEQYLQSIWGSLCNNYSDMEFWERAVKTCERHFELSIQNLPPKNSPEAFSFPGGEEVFSWFYLANAYVSVGDYDKAIRHLNRCVEIADKFSWSLSPHSISFYSTLAKGYLEVGKYGEAVKYYRQILESESKQNNNNSNNIENELGILQAKGNLGLALLKNGNLPEAEQELVAAVERFEKYRNLIFSSQVQNLEGPDLGQAKFNDENSLIYSSLQELRVKQGKPEEALEIGERGITNALAQTLSKNNTPPTITIPQMQAVAKEQNATLVKYSTTHALAYGTTHKYHLLVWVIQPNGQIHFRQVDPNSFSRQTFNTSQSILVPLLFGSIGASLALFLLLVKRRRNLALLVLIFSLISGYCYTSLGSGQFKQASGGVIRTPSILAANSLTAIKNEAQGKSSNSVSTRNCQNQGECLKQLNQLLIEPIKDLLPRNSEEQIIFIPDTTLLQVPFAALQDKQDKYLIEKHTIRTVPSIRTLHLLNQYQKTKQNPQLSNKALVVGNPVIPEKVEVNVDVPDAPKKYVRFASLPNAETEAKAVAQLLNTKAIIGEEATESLVVREIPQAKIIHLATHGDLRIGTFGDTGALLLTSSNKNQQNEKWINPDDGLLNPHEISRLNLNAELVVMSACETGLGIGTTDGVIGLVRPFLAGGVPTVIASLWTIPDAPTSELMVDFYKNLQANSDKAKALRQAMLTTMKKHPKPFNWAAFTLVGEAK